MNEYFKVHQIAKLLKAARRVLFITGAGISADSGLPTYRGVGGLYNDGGTEEGLAIEEALSGDCFSLRPDITWKYIAQIEENCRGAQPNAAHLTIAALSRQLPKVVLLTQNIDGLHHRAGSEDGIEIHGTLSTLYCTRCGFQESVATFEGREIPPPCPTCREVMRPKVVLFGESLPEDAVYRLSMEQEQGFDMVFIIGTSAVFPYIVEPVMWALQTGVPTVEINPAQTQLSRYVDFYLPLGAAAAMSAIGKEFGVKI